MCGFREAQLPQLSTLALALKSDGHLLPSCPWTPCSPAHCSLGTRTLQMIYYIYIEREFSRNPLLTSLSIILPFISPHSLSPTCQPYCYLALSPSQRKIHKVQIIDSPFDIFNFLLISVTYPRLLSGAAGEHMDCILLVMLFFNLLLITPAFLFVIVFAGWERSVHCSLCNSYSTKAGSSCLCLCRTNRSRILSD